MTKPIVTLIALAAMTGAAMAGGLSDPVVAPEIVAEAAVDSSEKAGGLIAAIALLLIIIGMGSGG
ncbi:hypothetical protein [Roseovarius pacificus]|uniref:hypothetical protein n=1 Tax=Roseovarius pacificus TaxID=337701 RepID=UPI00403A6078